ncbi:MAG: hypothetical protein ABIN66_09120 [candidate division WOR-3 bacterium]
MTGLLMSLMVSQGLWAKTYGGAGNDYFYSVDKTSDGGLVAVGKPYSFGGDPMVFKLSTSGDVQWTRVYDIGDIVYLNSVIQTSEGGYIATGENTYPSPGSVLLLRQDALGNLLWIKSYGTTEPSNGRSIIQTADGGFAVVGEVGYATSGNYLDVLVLKFSSAGVLEWARTFGGADYEYGRSIVQTTDNGFAIVGWTGALGPQPCSLLVVKLDASGGLVWARSFRFPGAPPLRDMGYSITKTSDGGLAIAGKTWITYDGGLTYYWDLLVFKLDATGGLLWARRLGEPGLDESGYSLIQTSDGGLVVGGNLDSSAVKSNFLLVKLDASGTLLWSRRFSGGYTAMTAGSIVETMDGGLAIGGHVWGGAGAYDLLVLKTDGNGNYPGCVNDWTPTVVNVSPNIASLSGWAVRTLTPTEQNPPLTTPSLTVMDVCPPVAQKELGESPHVSGITCSLVPGATIFLSPVEIPVSIYAPDGRLVYSGKLMKGQTRIPLEPGVYLWRAGTYKGKAVVR